MVPERDLERQSGKPGNSDGGHILVPRVSLTTLLGWRPVFRSLGDSYFTDVILAKSSVTMSLRVGEKSIEFRFSPVIARVDPTERVFPHGRIVYEPLRPTQTKADTAIQSYEGPVLSHGAFIKGELELLFPSAGKLVMLPLESQGDATRFSGGIRRFDKFEGGMPVELFLKDHGGGQDRTGAILHCVSVPVEFVRRCLAGKGGAMIGVRKLEGGNTA